MQLESKKYLYDIAQAAKLAASLSPEKAIRIIATTLCCVLL